MKKFAAKLFFLALLPALVIWLSLIIPPDKSFKKSLMYSQLDKNMLLADTKSPRIILVGGSNLSFGLDSKRIKDSLFINPVNTGVSAGIGLKFMLANASQYIRENDIIVISPEYHQFYGDFADGDLDLLSMIIDVPNQSFKLLDTHQRLKLCKYLPAFAASKYARFLRNDESLISDSIGIYDRLAFNNFGDAYIHWKLPKQNFSVYEFSGSFNDNIIHTLLKFQQLVNNRHAKLYITFPCFAASSFEPSKDRIKEVEHKLRTNGFNLISKPEEYEMADSLMFETAYHLNKMGVDYRTTLLIKDIKAASMNEKFTNRYN